MKRREALLALTAAAGSTLFASQGQSSKERVAGIGGVFFRARDPKLLAQWYQDNLGITVTPQSYDAQPWSQEAGPTVFAPFAEKTTYFGDPAKQWMVNFRVHDLDKMAKQLEAAGAVVKIDPTTYPNGRFARTHDPEGNPIELWQPMKSGK